MNPLKQLLERGQSYWLDNLTREMLRNGELSRRVREEGLRGVTSNPAIFHAAMSKGDDYDEQIDRLIAEGRAVQEVYETLVVTDIKDACDALRPVWDESTGQDGYVSLEVSPYLAHDTDGTIEEACRLAARVERPNLFIKIPGTAAGVPAIEECLFRGININVTLLFSIESYEAVALAYIRALERRLESGQAVDDVASVASFFLSRIDILTDQLLGHRITPESTAEPRAAELFGQAAVANAKLAYARFLELTDTDRWKSLATSGARVQRMLWASTSTKNPLYDEVRYVEPLIGPDTVNTLPDDTIEAFAGRGRVATTVTDDLEEARTTLDRLAEVGIDFARVTWQLENEGVQKFIDPFDKLMEAIAGRMAEATSELVGQSREALGDFEKRVASTLGALRGAQFGRRIFAHDTGLWGAWDPDGRAAVQAGLGWLDSPVEFTAAVPEIEALAAGVREDGLRHVVLLGMGGSSLSAEVARSVFGPQADWPELTVLDSTAPEAILDVQSRIDLAATLFIVASKSGTTQETSSFYRYFWDKVAEALGSDPGDRFVAITDAGTPLAGEAAERGFRGCFENPADIGGRYSVLSYFGLIPMALMGVDVRELVERACVMRRLCGAAVPPANSPGVRLGTSLATLAKSGRDKITFTASPTLSSFGLWAEQLLAESTGKNGLGLIPVAGEPPADASRYGADRVFVRLELAGDPDSGSEAWLSDLESEHPVIRITLPDRAALGAEFYRWELAVATAGALLGINPFDQPNVTESKQNTRRLLDELEERGAFPEPEPTASDDEARVYWGGDESLASRFERPADALQSLEGLAGDGDYLAILAFVAPGEQREETLQALRRSFLADLGVATTLGYGPRYLHSTGQLHKGGPDRGVFLMLTADDAEGLEIPGEPFDFSALLRAQALGDYESLSGRGRRILRVHVVGDLETWLDALGTAARERVPAGQAAGA